MNANRLLERARRASGLTQEEVARRAGTSRPTLSAYEHGRKSPTLETTRRLLEATGHALEAVPRVEFHQHPASRRRDVWVADRLWRLPVNHAVGSVLLPLHLDWSTPGHRADLSDRHQRARVYEIVLQEGTPADIGALVDGALLVDLWDELVLPRTVRSAWHPVIRRELDSGAL